MKNRAIGVCVGILFAEGQRLWQEKLRQQQQQQQMQQQFDRERDTDSGKENKRSGFSHASAGAHYSNNNNNNNIDWNTAGGRTKESAGTTSKAGKRKKKMVRLKRKLLPPGNPSPYLVHLEEHAQQATAITAKIDELKAQLAIIESPKRHNDREGREEGEEDEDVGPVSRDDSHYVRSSATAPSSPTAPGRKKKGKMKKKKTTTATTTSAGTAVPENATAGILTMHDLAMLGDDDSSAPPSNAQRHVDHHHQHHQPLPQPPKKKRPSSAPSARLYTAPKSREEREKERAEKELMQKEKNALASAHPPPPSTNHQPQNFTYDLKSGRRILLSAEEIAERQRRALALASGNTIEIDLVTGAGVGGGGGGGGGGGSGGRPTSPGKSPVDKNQACNQSNPNPNPGPTRPEWPGTSTARSTEQWVKKMREEREGGKDKQNGWKDGGRYLGVYDRMEGGDVILSVEHCHSCAQHNATLRHDAKTYCQQASLILKSLAQVIIPTHSHNIHIIKITFFFLISSSSSLSLL